MIIGEKKPRFCAPEKEEFYRVLRKQVNRYFKENQIKRTGNTGLYIKTAVLFLGMILPFVGLFITRDLPAWLFLMNWAIMGFSMAGIGLAIMHDSVHGAYSSNRIINEWVGHICMFFIGGFVANWKIQHNQLHHTFTNIKDFDEDINPPLNLLRLSPDYQLEGKHKFQFIYAWFLYMMMTLMWCTTKDFRQLKRFGDSGFYSNRKAEYKKEWFRLILFKSGYFFYFIGAPILWTNYSVWYIVVGFVIMHVIAGFILAIVFQPAHVVPEAQFPTPDEQNQIHDSWATHQLITTQNFANGNSLLSWYVGGLNFQIEHHLFPNISHVHYSRIAPIVKRVALEFGLPYQHTTTFYGAIKQHGEMLYKLGR